MARRCERCDGVNIELKPDYPIKRTRAGISYVSAIPAEVCCDCGMALYNGAVYEAWEMEFALALARGPVGGDAFRSMRRFVGMNVADAADLMGVTRETIRRWESEGSQVPKPAFMMMGLAVYSEAGYLVTADQLVEERKGLEDVLRALGWPEKKNIRVDLSETVEEVIEDELEIDLSSKEEEPCSTEA